ncbi:MULTISPECIES: LysR family transcriptional regulator [unclassified Arthrobacter]|uniref:LysR family transcriptional regulator n=1 Tax=unclassified Arthrobacter TaxID=235627 RepID=UPI001C85D550|nr:LysR family transcriptional regulator [Arthrobacter sp. MAHUQ-56]MBX7445284.1 LysR family transcriptional regulator [Arthrobacter sp. MAHUQ-56]
MEPDRKQLAQLLPLLPVLAELGRTEHVTETAELLGVPQSTVSRAVARASAAVGTELVVRDGRGVRLTPAARTLLPYIGQALAEFQAGLDLVRNESEVVRGRISVSFQHTFGEATLPLLISAFRARHAGAEFRLSQGARSTCLAELASGEADLALTAPVAEPGKNLRTAPLYREPLRLVVHHGHPLARQRAARVADLRGEPFVALEPGYGLRSLTDALFREAGYRPRIAFESQDSHTVRGLVSAGLGVSILPPGGDAPGRLVRPETGNLGWVEVPLDSALAFRVVGVSWRRRKPENEPVAVRLFRELVANEGPGLLAGLVRQGNRVPQ